MASFELYLPKLFQVEAGFQKHPDDAGNYNSLGQLVGTNRGISARFYEQIIKRPPTEADIKAITKEEATGLYRQYFWNPLRANEIKSQFSAETIVDHHINSGQGARLAQKVLNQDFNFNLSEDNIIGSKTLSGINSISDLKFVPAYNEARANFYRSLSNSASFINGWLNRIKEFAISKTGGNVAVFLGVVASIGLFFLIKQKS